MTVRVEGLKEFRSALRQGGKELPKELQKVNKAFAADVAGDVRSKYTLAHPSRSGRGAQSIRALASQTRAQVAIGSARASYVLGQNFGSHQGPRKKQFRPVRKPDYFLYRTLEQRDKDLRDDYDELLEGLVHRLAEG